VKLVACPEQESSRNTRSYQHFAALINAAWRRGPEAIIEAARCIREASEELDRDQFEALLKFKLSFDASVGRKLKRIGENRVLCAHGHKLPACWTTIYELSKLEDELLKAAIADGRIHPGMERKDASELRKPNVKGSEKSAESKPSFAAAWDAASKEEIRAKLDAVGRDGLCTVLSDELKAALRDHVLGQTIHTASKDSNFAVSATNKLHTAIRCAELTDPDSEAIGHMTGALRWIASAGERRQIARSDIVITVADRKPKHRKKK
jgi:hypothetical protein